MKKQIEKILQWIAEEPVEQKPQKTAIDLAIEKTMSWLLHNLVPVLLITLAIDLTIMFTSPMEVAMSRWFWLKTPLSIAVAYLICKFFKSICRHLT